jgi:hypothetical protein
MKIIKVFALSERWYPEIQYKLKTRKESLQKNELSEVKNGRFYNFQHIKINIFRENPGKKSSE